MKRLYPETRPTLCGLPGRHSVNRSKRGHTQDCYRELRQAGFGKVLGNSKKNLEVHVCQTTLLLANAQASARHIRTCMQLTHPGTCSECSRILFPPSTGTFLRRPAHVNASQPSTSAESSMPEAERQCASDNSPVISHNHMRMPEPHNAVAQLS